MTTALRAQFEGFMTLRVVSEEGDNASSDQTLLFVAQFTEQVALARIAAVLTPVFEEFVEAQVSVSVGGGARGAKLTEE